MTSFPVGFGPSINVYFGCESQFPKGDFAYDLLCFSASTMLKMFYITPLDSIVVHPILLSSRKDSEFSYLSIVLTHLVSTYYSGQYLPGGFEEVRQIATLVISELAILAAVKFFRYADQGAALDHFSGFLRFDHAADRILFWLPPPFPDTMHHLRFSRLSADANWIQ